MKILAVLLIAAIGYVFIILLNIIANAFKQKDNGDFRQLVYFNRCNPEIVKDGNNLLVTCIIYIIGFLVSYFLHINIVSYILMAIGIIAAAISVFSLFGMIKQSISERNKYIDLMTISAFINSIVPLIIAILIYPFCILDR